MKNVTIKEEDIKSIITNSIIGLEGFEWSGWGIDIILDNDGDVFETDVNNGQNLYVEADVICRIDRWSVREIEEEENIDYEASLEYWSSEIYNECIERIKSYEFINIRID